MSFLSTFQVPILIFVPGVSSIICDVTSSSVHCSANFPSLQALVCKFPCSPGPGHLLDLLLSFSEFLGHDVASEVFVLLVQLLGVRRLTLLLLSLLAYLCMSVPCVLLSVFKLCSRPLLCSLCNLNFDTFTALLSHLSHLLQCCGCSMWPCFW